MTADPPSNTSDVHLERDLVQSWERQQESYIPAREARYELMTDVLSHTLAALGRPARILDLACGPGSASRRVATAMNDVELVALDVDPVLLALASRTWPPHLVEPRWLRADLTNPSWTESVATGAQFDAVVSTTALHWLTHDQLRRVYASVFALLRPGGIFLNGDFAPTARAPSMREATEAVVRRREERAASAGALSWDQWWSEVADSGLFDEELETRRAFFAERSPSPAPSLNQHLHALLEAGFTAVEVVWQDLDEVLLAGVA